MLFVTKSFAVPNNGTLYLRNMVSAEDCNVLLSPCMWLYCDLSSVSDSYVESNHRHNIDQV